LFTMIFNKSTSSTLFLTLFFVTISAEDPAVLIHNKKLLSPGCTSPVERDALYIKYHSDNSCNRAHYNAYKASLNRQATYHYFRTSGTHHLVPDRSTVICPAVVQELYQPNQEMGYDSDWMVENTASTPVVLAWVDPESGVEYSAFNHITPPQNDPIAIVQPGQWRHLHTFEGHVFHAREVLEDGSTGRVLLQHRVGLIPIGEQAASDGRLMGCNLHDPEPIVEQVVDQVVQQTVAPEYQRTPLKPMMDCNQIAMGFRNRAGCPLHGYFIQANTCHEVFKLHLGTTSPQIAQDFHHDWASDTKFETSFVGHSFVFRSTSDPSILVDRVDVRATQIIDCPDLKQQTSAVRLPADVALPAVASIHNNNTMANTTTAGSVRLVDQLDVASVLYSAGMFTF